MTLRYKRVEPVRHADDRRLQTKLAVRDERIPTFTERELVRCIVESPRGARVKFEYDKHSGIFKINRPLPTGLAYPFDWGFVAGTCADDGDPIDAVILGDQVPYPGTLIESRIVSALYVCETAAGHDKTAENPRIVLVPEWIDSAAAQAEVARVRPDLERFLVIVGESARKKILEHRWERAEGARRYIDERVIADR